MSGYDEHSSKVWDAGRKVTGDFILKYMCKQKGPNSPVHSFAGISTSYQVGALIMSFGLSELGNLKIQCLKSLSTWDFFIKALIHPAFQLLMSLHTLPCSLFLDCWKYLASEQYLSSEFRSQVALSQSWDIGCPTGGGTKRPLSVSFSLIRNMARCKESIWKPTLHHWGRCLEALQELPKDTAGFYCPLFKPKVKCLQASP